jgi:MFS family permease
MSDRRGRKALMKLGTFGFISSMALCGIALWLGLHGMLAASMTFVAFALFRSLYGGLGSAAPPAVQAYVAARTAREERTKALSLLASSFGLGTVIGPAIAPYLVLEPLGLSGPLIIFAAFGVLVLLAVQFRLPNDEPSYAARGAVAAYPSAAAPSQVDLDSEDGEEERTASDAGSDDALPRRDIRLPWRDERLLSWLWVGLIGGHAQAILLGIIGFLVRDRLGLQDDPNGAVQAIGSVMFVGAMATLLAQWGLIPLLSMQPRSSIRWGTILALIGTIFIALGQDLYNIALGFAIASLGFGLFRPGFTAGASLAVRRDEQGDVAGKIASINGAAYIFAPALGVALFNWWEPATFLLMGAMLIGMLAYGYRQRSAG